MLVVVFIDTLSSQQLCEPLPFGSISASLPRSSAIFSHLYDVLSHLPVATGGKVARYPRNFLSDGSRLITKHFGGFFSELAGDFWHLSCRERYLTERVHFRMRFFQGTKRRSRRGSLVRGITRAASWGLVGLSFFFSASSLPAQNNQTSATSAYYGSAT